MSEPEWSLPLNRRELIERCEALEAALTAIRDFRQETNEWDGIDECMPRMREIAAAALRSGKRG